MEKNTNSRVNVIELLGLVFIILKLTNFIDWNWFCVVSPFIFEIIMIVIIAIIKTIKDSLDEGN